MSDRHQTDLLKLTVGRFLEGDSAQYRIVRAKITQYVYHRLRDGRIDRDEIVDETITILYQNLRAGAFRGDSVTAFSVYIYSIVRNRVSRACHRIRRLTPGADVPDVPGPDEERAHEHRQRVEQILDALDQNCRKLLQRKFIEGWINQEIADEAGKTKNAVSTHISRCLKKAQKAGF